jgi:RNA polymerase sigma-70 factor (ECF subfamily)
LASAPRREPDRPDAPDVEAASENASRPGGASVGSSGDPDHDLVALAQQGQEEAFAGLVRRHQQRAFRVARNLVPSDEDARDLVQEAFLRVFRHLERFDFRYPFTTWLHRIVTNLAIDHLRRRRVPVASGGGDGDEDDGPAFERADPSAPAPSRRLEADETGQLVRDCIAALAPHFQTVLVLRELEGMSCAEISEIVGATPVTVRWRLHRGRKLFQEEWERRERLAEAGLGPASAPPTPARAVRKPSQRDPESEPLDEPL